MFEKIKEIIVDKLNIDDDSFITLDTDLMEDLNADSLDAVEIIMDIEDEFDITVEEEDVEQIRTISDIINYIEENN
ncbi:MAG: Acyl carrier protein [Peptostreptococcus russellii]|uniref:Acyl carrier protein n=1 Tax=Peptostreptococcus russellii TaxID=215200 RepID=A0A2P7Q0C8_9FIRM|nr:acyl carrier protein [Peptostreptococcus russellii]PSJ31429.1 acyl carrier protein [Peptostreptococcus russellii]